MNPTLSPVPPLPGRAGLSFDLEDWHRIARRRFEGRDPGPSGHVRAQTRGLLALLGRHQARATFFVLGRLAEAEDDLVGEVRDAGHEIATHGHEHVPLQNLRDEDAVADVARSLDVLRPIAGTAILGHRAPEFSIHAGNLHLLRDLAHLGIRYDSSVYPVRHPRYGIPGFPPRPTRLSWPTGGEVMEFPLLTLRLPWAALPVAGGGYYRLLPRTALEAGLRRQLRAGGVPVLYFHPYEFQDERLSVEGLPRSARAAAWLALQNLGRRRLPGNLKAMLARHRFQPLGEIFRELDERPRVAPPTTILRAM